MQLSDCGARPDGMSRPVLSQQRPHTLEAPLPPSRHVCSAQPPKEEETKLHTGQWCCPSLLCMVLKWLSNICISFVSTLGQPITTLLWSPHALGHTMTSSWRNDIRQTAAELSVHNVTNNDDAWCLQ